MESFDVGNKLSNLRFQGDIALVSDFNLSTLPFTLS
jgi:hypothetical protein